MGELIIIEAFVVVVLGGLGSLRGAFLGAVVIGLLHAYGLLSLPVFELAVAYVVMAAGLIIRPRGFFGVRGAWGDGREAPRGLPSVRFIPCAAGSRPRL